MGVRDLAEFLAIESFGDGCFKTTSLGIMLEVEGLYCLLCVVSVGSKN